jgi:hypothetical protein
VVVRGLSLPWMVMKVVSIVANIGIQVRPELRFAPISLHHWCLEISNLMIHARTSGKESQRVRRSAMRNLGKVVSVTRRVVRKHKESLGGASYGYESVGMM